MHKLVQVYVCSAEYVNDWDEVIAFQCPQNGYITGIDSYHDNGHEDRRFKFRCCELTGNITLTRLCNILRIMRLQKRYRVPAI